jgi:chemotaxis protein MotB
MSKGSHGGSWKVAYADFVTAMMALFLVLWLTAQDTRVKEAIERAFRNPFSSATKESVGIIPNKDVQATHEQKGNFDSASALHLELLRRLTEDLSKLLQQDPENQNIMRLATTSDGLLISVFDRPERPLFEVDSAELTPFGTWVFSTLAWEVSRYPNFALELTGHTESGRRPIRPDYGDWELSADRANAARRKLLEHGVVQRQVFKVSGLGSTVPIDGVHPGDPINRRVSLLLKLDDAVHPDTATTDRPSTLATSP